MKDSTTPSQQPPRPSAEQEPAAIIATILERYHEPLRRDLPALVSSARALEADTQARPDGPRGLAARLEQVRLSVESHLQKEERILFPLILGGRGALAHMPIKVMMAEHLLPAAGTILARYDGHDNHYKRKENQLFPLLERHGITGPSQVMWGVHEQM